jgi:ZIP family zinc transporter
MSFAETTLLGAIAGFTIFLGLPIGRMRRVGTKTRVALAMFSLGILAFIFMDVASHGQAIVEDALDAYKNHHGSLGHVIGLFALLALGITLGTAGIALFEARLRRRGGRLTSMPIAGGEAGTLTAEDAAAAERTADVARQMALRTGMTIATAIGLHNFAEGLAIGVSAKTGETALATVLVVGFALHNATEGFGIVGPLGAIRPSWKWLGLAGLIGGSPTFLGTMLGYQVRSDALELCFYALAAGALLYVIGEIWIGTRRHGHRNLGLFLLAAGFLAGVATDLIVAYGGG